MIPLQIPSLSSKNFVTQQIPYGDQKYYLYRSATTKKCFLLEAWFFNAICGLKGYFRNYFYDNKEIFHNNLQYKNTIFTNSCTT